MKVEKRKLTDMTVSADRVRDDVGDLADLKASMSGRGQINPVTITEDGKLITGFRRLSAARELGWEEIACHIWRDADAPELLALEVEENTCRAPLTYAEAERAWRKYRTLLGLPEEASAATQAASVKATKTQPGWRDHDVTAKLTTADVAAIKERFQAGGVSQRQLAGEYGVTPTTIGNALRRAGALGPPGETRAAAVRSRRLARSAIEATGYTEDLLTRVRLVRKAAGNPDLPDEVRQVASEEYAKLETQTRYDPKSIGSHRKGPHGSLERIKAASRKAAGLPDEQERPILVRPYPGGKVEVRVGSPRPALVRRVLLTVAEARELAADIVAVADSDSREQS